MYEIGYCPHKILLAMTSENPSNSSGRNPHCMYLISSFICSFETLPCTNTFECLVFHSPLFPYKWKSTSQESAIISTNSHPYMAKLSPLTERYTCGLDSQRYSTS